MSGRWIAAVVAVVWAAVPGAASAWDPGLVLDVAEAGVYTITPSELPPSKLVVHLHTERGEEHQLSWDGKQTSRLVRTVQLTPGRWEVDVWSEAINVPVWGDQGLGPSAYPMPGPQWNRAGVGAGLEEGSGDWRCKDETGSSRRTAGGCAIKAGEGATLELRWREPKSSRPVFSAETFVQQGMEGLLADRFLYIDIARRPKTPLQDAASRLIDGPSREAVGGARAFGETAVPAAVVEAFELLAELAFEMARTRSFEFLSSRLELLLCEDLRWEKIDAEGRKQLFPASTAGSPWLPASLAEEDPILPTTCEVVRNIRMEDLATAGEPLYQALMADLGTFGLHVANDWLLATTGNSLEQVKEALLPVIKHAADIVVGLVTGRKAVAQDSARLLLAELAIADWTALIPSTAAPPKPDDPPTKPGSTTEQKQAACGLAVSFAVIGACYEDGGCTPQQVLERVLHADQYFDLGECKAVVGDDVRQAWPEIASFVSQGLEIVIQAEDTPPEQTVRAAVDLAFQVTDKVLEATVSSKETLADARKVIDHLAEIFDGILAQDAASVVSRTASLFRFVLLEAAADKSRPGREQLKGDNKKAMAALEKGTALLSAITTYSTTFAQDEVDAEKKREARKEALRQLIISTTNRRLRDGEVVVSVGATVGLRAVGYRWVPRGGTGLLADVPVNQTYLANFSMPMGVAIQRLPDGEFDRGEVRALKNAGIGAHLQFSVVDLGNFITHGVEFGGETLAEGKPVGSSVRWDQFFTFDLQAGAIFGTPSAPFVLGVNVRYSPGVFGRQPTEDTAGVSGGAFETGVFVGFYVPFFDFN